MKELFTRSADAPQGDVRMPSYLTEKNQMIQWWYRLASPAESKSLVSFKERSNFVVGDRQ